MLSQKIRNRESGICLYGLTPPKLGQEEGKIRDIAGKQMQRIAALAPDALVLYDLQEEPGRNGESRPFPFLPTLEPTAYAREFLMDLNLPKVFYKCIAGLGREEFHAWWQGRDSNRDAFVLVGSPTSHPIPEWHGNDSARPADPFTLAQAYAVLAQSPSTITQSPGTFANSPATIANSPASTAQSSVTITQSPVTTASTDEPGKPCFGGVAIAERHHRKGNEDSRLFRKYSDGCGFFISQTVYDPSATKSLLSDYALRFAREGSPTPPFILSFSPCGSLKTMEFMKWLGIGFPRWLENELIHTSDILAKSVDLAVQVFTDVSAFAREKSIPIGVNVESVSIRKDEIEASCELFTRLAKLSGR